MNPDFFNRQEFFLAVNDYYQFLCRQYPQSTLLKIVGDRYKLTGGQRTMLLRGVFSASQNNQHRARLYREIKNQELHIDAYNVLFTILNYRMGRLVFLSSDGFCRDAGSLFGKIRRQEQFSEALNLLIGFLKSAMPGFLVFYYDSPVSFSREHKYLTEKFCDENELDASVMLIKSADAAIKTNKSGIVCTSDSAIIDAVQCPVTDLPFGILNHFYKPLLLDLQNFIQESSGV